MSLYEILLIVHILGAFMIAGGQAVATVLGIAMTRTSSTRLLVSMSSLANLTEFLLLVPGMLLAIIFATWLVDEAGFDYGDGWIIAAYVLWAIVFAIGALVLGPHSRRLNRRARVAAADGVEESDELRREAAAPLIGLLGTFENLALVAFLYLMVAKPGG